MTRSFAHETLPVSSALPELMRALDAGNAVLVAPPGAGKTTTVPLALLDASWRAGGRIVMLEPRRLAARAAAQRMSALIGAEVGGRVGYRTRLHAAVSPATEIEVVTEGLLVRRLLADPGLDGTAAVVFDEIHERSLDADLALALCLELQRDLRPELRLVAMSATLDGARLAAHMDAAVVESAGRAHPVEIRHAARDIQHPRDLADTVARAVRGALGETAGGVLAFLPGMGELRRAAESLCGCGADVLLLHGDLPQAEQDRALVPGTGRRVVLATSIAETSLTVPGIRIVVDGGWRRAPRYDPATGLTRLVTERVSRAAADQRAGRAGREAPGLAIRCWTAALHRGLAAYDRPEIMAAELSGLVLAAAAWGATPEQLPLPDAPPEGPLAAARALLAGLGALDGEGRITPEGRRMVALGAHPRLAAAMLAARDDGERALAADIAALLEERDPLRDGGADLTLRLDALRTGEGDRATLARIRQSAARYRDRLRTRTRAAGDPGRLVAAAFPDRIAESRGEGAFRFAGGGGARLPAADPLARRPGLLAVAALAPGRATEIALAAPLDPAHLPDAVASRVTETLESGLDPATGAVFSRRRRRLGALVLEDRVVPAPAGEAAAVLARAAAADLARLPWTSAARQFQARAALLRTLDPDVPDLSDAALAARAETWLVPHLTGATRLADLASLDLVAMLRAELGHAAAARLDRDLPAALALPHGHAPIDYLADVPTASARAQAFFGLRDTPRLAQGRVELRLALLSPAGRPAAVTGDLARFWQSGWADVRRDMRGRYPKHSWPEHPGTGSK